MSNQWQGQERREHPRSPVGAGRVVETEVVDVSLSGALLEVPSTLPSRSRYVLRLPVGNGRNLELEGEVVRSYVHGFEKDASGRPTAKYRAAIKFLELAPEVRRDLERFLEESRDDVGRRAELRN